MMKEFDWKLEQCNIGGLIGAICLIIIMLPITIFLNIFKAKANTGVPKR